MADESSIIINIKAQSDVDEATKQIAEMLKNARDLAAQSGKLQQANSTLSSSFQQEAQAASKSIDSLKDATKQSNMLTGAAKSMRTELREVSQRLQELAEAGDTTSSEFIILADRAAAMNDTMGDTQAIIRILASDTKKLDTALAIGGGLTGAFNAATSAAALLGGESEELNKAFLKVQAAMAILNGLQQVGLVLDKRSAANVVLRTAYTKLMAKANVDAAVSQNILNKAMMANPVGMVLAAIAALATALWVLKDKIEPVSKAVEKLSGWFNRSKIESEAAAEAADRQADALRRVEQAAQSLSNVNTGSSMDELNKGLQNSIQLYDAYVSNAKRAGQEGAAFYQDILDAQKNAENYLANGDIANALAWQSQFQRMLDSMDETEKSYYAMIVGTQEKIEALQNAQADSAEKAAKDRADAELKEYQEAFRSRQEADKQAADDAYAAYSASEKKRREEIEKTRKLKEEADAALADAAKNEADEEMAYSDEVAEHDIENAEKAKQAQIAKYQEAMQVAQECLQFVADMTNEVFGIMSDKISAELDELSNMYTTDAEEAQKNAKKKYITQADYDKKEKDLKIKQAKLDKANAAFQIGLSTAMAIMRIWADVPKVDFGAATIALTATTAALGAVQLAAALAKPLPQYAKGRKGGQGEMAIVGERGAEMVYLPEGASVIPHGLINKPDAWGAYGVPQLSMPDLPSTDIITTIAMLSATGQIDYDRMGAAIAKHMPKQKAVSINVDRNGVSVSDGHDAHTYLNTKYQASWS